MHKISKPAQKTFFITYTDQNIFAYGVIGTEEEMVSGQPYIYTTTSRKEWITELKKYSMVEGYKFDDDSSETRKTMSEIIRFIVSKLEKPITEKIDVKLETNGNFYWVEGDWQEVLGTSPSFFSIK